MSRQIPKVTLGGGTPTLAGARRQPSWTRDGRRQRAGYPHRPLKWRLLLTLATAAVTGLAPASFGQSRGRSILRNGDFMEDPDRPVNWQTRGNAALGVFTLLPAGPGESSAVLSVTVQKKDEEPWALELRQPLGQPLNRGETLYITFEYRLSPGYAFHCYWQKEAPPWPKFLAIRIAEPVDEWTECAMAVRVHNPLPARASSLSFHLAEAKGRVDLRNLNVVVFPAAVSPESLPSTADPVFGGDYYDQNWRDSALARIDLLRKAPFDVRVVAGDQAAPNVTVRIEQKSRAFHFGTDIAAPLFVDRIPDQPEFAATAAAINGLDPQVRKYRAKVMDKRLFNMVSLRRGLGWRESTSWPAAMLDAVVAQFRKNGQQVRGHALYCPTYRTAPSTIRHLSAADLARELYGYVETQTKRFRGRMFEWDVVYAPLTHTDILDLIRPESLIRVFTIAAKETPDTRLVYAEDKALLLPAPGQLEETMAVLRWLREKGARVDAVALDATMTRPYIAPQAIEDRLNRLHEYTQLPLVITSLGVESSRENTQAERLRNLLILFFSHPAVTGICLPGIWEALMPNPKASLFRNRFAIKPAGKVYEQLVGEQWWTRTRAKTDAAGWVRFRGFHGDYELAVEVDGKQLQWTRQLSPDGLKVIVDTTTEAATTAE